MAKSVLFFGHSWAHRLGEDFEQNNLDKECRFDPDKQVCFFAHSIYGRPIYTIKECLERWDEVSTFVRGVDLLVFLLGANDIASDPTHCKEWAHELVQMGLDLHLHGLVKRIAFVEAVPRVGPRSFRRTDTEAEGEGGQRTAREVSERRQW